MAERKPIFISTEGYSEEMAQTDSMTLGALSIHSSGTGIDMNGKKVSDMGSATTAGDALAYAQSGASLAGLGLTANLTMGTNKITGLGDGVNPQDAVTKSQLDYAVINGGSLKEILFDQGQLDNTYGIKAAEVLIFEAQPAVGDTISVKNAAVTVTMTAVANQGAESAETDFSIESSMATAMARFVTRFNAATANTVWDSIFRDTGHPDLNVNGVIMVVEKVTAAGASTSRIYGTWATPANCHVVEFASGGVVNVDYLNETEVNLPAADPAEVRFGFRRQQSALLANETHLARTDDIFYTWNDDDNVWIATSGPSSIPDATAASGGGIKGKITVDSDKGLAVASGVLSIKVETDGAITFDSTNKGLQVNLESSNPSLQIATNQLGVKLGDGVTKDTNGLTLRLEASNPTLALTGTSPNKELGVKAGDGLTADSNGLMIDLPALNPGLELTGTSPDKELDVKAGDGITKDSNGVRVDLTTNGGLTLAGSSPDKTLGVLADGTKAITVGAGGVGVILDSAAGLAFDGTSGGIEVNLEATNPSLQIVANELGVKYDSMKGLTKGATGLQVQVDGTTVSFDGSGNLQAIGSDEAQRVENTLNTATDTTANGDPVYINGSNTVGKADADADAKARIVGVIRTGAGAAPASVQIVTSGKCAGVLSGATPNTPYYVASGGGLTTTPPGAGKRLIRVGLAISATDLWVDIIDYGKKAA